MPPPGEKKYISKRIGWTLFTFKQNTNSVPPNPTKFLCLTPDFFTARSYFESFVFILPVILYRQKIESGRLDCCPTIKAGVPNICFVNPLIIYLIRSWSNLALQKERKIKEHVIEK